GDLSENGDYHAAKEEQGKMEGRIRQLAYMLENAEIVESDGGEPGAHGSGVSIRYEGDDDVERYLIGSIEERHDDLDVISPSSPLGEALLGSHPREEGSLPAPTGAALTVEVVAIDGPSRFGPESRTPRGTSGHRRPAGRGGPRLPNDV